MAAVLGGLHAGVAAVGPWRWGSSGVLLLAAAAAVLVLLLALGAWRLLRTAHRVLNRRDRRG